MDIYTGHEVDGCEICNHSHDACVCVQEKLSEDFYRWLNGGLTKEEARVEFISWLQSE